MVVMGGHQCFSLNEEAALLLRKLLSTQLEAGDIQLHTEMIYQAVLLPGEHQIEDISNMIRAIFRNEPAGLRSCSSPCSKAVLRRHHSGCNRTVVWGWDESDAEYWTARMQQDQTHCPCLCTVPQGSLWHPSQFLKGTSIHWSDMLPHQMWIYKHFLLEKSEAEYGTYLIASEFPLLFMRIYTIINRYNQRRSSAS